MPELIYCLMKNKNEMSGGVKDAEVLAEGPKVFAKLTFDKGFKIVLGTEGRSEKILIPLLNRILNLRIVELQFLQTEKMGLTEEDSKSVFDVYCKDEFGRRFLVEMQMWGQRYFNMRSSIYLAFTVLDQFRDAKKRCIESEKEWDYYFEPVYVIAFLNQRNNISEDPNDPRVNPYVSRYITRSIATGKDLEDGTNRVFIDLYRFRKTFEDCSDDLERWLFSIKNMHLLKESPDGIDGTELEDLYFESKLAAWDPDLRTKYDRLMGNEHDRILGVLYEKEMAREEGLAEGRAKGIEEGREVGRKEGREVGRKEGIEVGRAEGESEKAIQIAKNMLAKGMAITDIADLTGLSVEDIELL